MESGGLDTLDKELLLHMVQYLSYREILQWCDSNRHFQRLCRNDPLFYDGVILMKLLEEGLAQIFVDIKSDGKYVIHIDMIQDKVNFHLRELTPTLFSDLLHRVTAWEEADFRHPLLLPNNINLRFLDYVPLYGSGRFVKIETSNVGYIMLASDLENILLVASEMIEKGFILRGEIEGHVVLLLDGTTEFVAH